MLVCALGNPKQGATSLINLTYRGAGHDNRTTRIASNTCPFSRGQCKSFGNIRLNEKAACEHIVAVNSRDDRTHTVSEPLLISRGREFAFQLRDDRKVGVQRTHAAFRKEERSARSLVTIPDSGLPSEQPWESFVFDDNHEALSRQGQHPKHRTLQSATPVWGSSRCSHLTCQL